MAELDATRQRGWSYEAGYSQDARAYLARAWKPRPKPFKTADGVTLVLHSVSATGDTLDGAAVICAKRAVARDGGDKLLSDHERRYVAAVLCWRP